jgi:CBS domain-containing protein
MHVSAVIKRKGNTIVTITGNQTIAEAANQLTANRIGAVLVVDRKDTIAGIISERDIIRGVAEHGAKVLDMAVERLMTREVLTCRPGDTISDIMGVMTRQRIRHLPVVDDGKLLGIISIGDVVKQRLDEADLEVETLRGYVIGNS